MARVEVVKAPESPLRDREFTPAELDRVICGALARVGSETEGNGREGAVVSAEDGSDPPSVSLPASEPRVFAEAPGADLTARLKKDYQGYPKPAAQTVREERAKDQIAAWAQGLPEPPIPDPE